MICYQMNYVRIYLSERKLSIERLNRKQTSGFIVPLGFTLPV